MASHKPKILALCKQIASEHEGWQFVGGKFVNKISKDAHFIINPHFVFKGSYMFFNVWGGVKLPKICRMVDKVSHLTFKMGDSILEQLTSLNLNSLTGAMSFTFEGAKANSDELIAQEMHRWITDAEEYLLQTWPVEGYSTLFDVMKQSPSCYKGLYGVSLCCLAAYLGEFDFIEQYFAGEWKYAELNPINPSGYNFLAILPEWKAEWEKTGTIKV